jgi:type VI protein secretion system component VasF
MPVKSRAYANSQRRNAMSMTLSHHLAQMTQKTAQSSPVLWIAAAAMLVLVTLGYTLPPVSFNADDAQMRATLVGP